MHRLLSFCLVLLCTACPAPLSAPDPHPCETVNVPLESLTGELDAPCHDNSDCDDGLGCDPGCADFVSECMGTCAPLDDPNRFCRWGTCEEDVDCGAQEAAEGLRVCQAGDCILGPNAGI